MKKLKSYTFFFTLLLISLFAARATMSTSLIASNPLDDQDEKVMWETYTTESEEFSVLMPKLPTAHLSKNCFDAGCRTKREENTYASYSNGVVYFVKSFQTPDGPSLDEIISERISPAIRESSSTTISDVKANKFKGMKFVYSEETKGYNVVSVFYLTKEHVYEVTAAGGNRNDLEIQKFIESFTLGDRRGKEIGNGATRYSIALAVESTPGKGESPSANNKPPEIGGAQLERIFKPTEVTRKAVIILKPSPEYTEDARQNLVVGTVTLQMTLTGSGKVTNIRTINGLPFGLTERAIAAARKLYFLPAVKDGNRVSQWIRVEYNFRMY